MSNLDITDPKKLMQPGKTIYRAATLTDLFSDLKEHAVYLVAVCYAPGNPVHEAIMLTGFKHGSYWMLCSTGYEYPCRLDSIHALQVTKELHKFDRKNRW